MATSTRAPNKDHGRPQSLSLVRYTTAGQLDDAFGDGGKVVTQLSKNHLSWPAALLLQADGKGSSLTQPAGREGPRGGFSSYSLPG